MVSRDPDIEGDDIAETAPGHSHIVQGKALLGIGASVRQHIFCLDGKGRPVRGMELACKRRRDGRAHVLRTAAGKEAEMSIGESHERNLPVADDTGSKAGTLFLVALLVGGKHDFMSLGFEPAGKIVRALKRIAASIVRYEKHLHRQFTFVPSIPYAQCSIKRHLTAQTYRCSMKR